MTRVSEEHQQTADWLTDFEAAWRVDKHQQKLALTRCVPRILSLTFLNKPKQFPYKFGLWLFVYITMVKVNKQLTESSKTA